MENVVARITFFTFSIIVFIISILYSVVIIQQGLWGYESIITGIETFWFRWNFIDPIKMWYWMNISHKPYCLEYGFFLEKEGCAAPKLYTKKEIKEHWKKISEEEFGGYY